VAGHFAFIGQSIRQIEKFKPLLLLSDGWAHLYYNEIRHKSLLRGKPVPKPLPLSTWRRQLYSVLLGGYWDIQYELRQSLSKNA
jgi:hypothetical protein